MYLVSNYQKAIKYNNHCFIFHSHFMKKTVFLLLFCAVVSAFGASAESVRQKCNGFTFDRLRPVLSNPAINKSESMLKTGTVKFPFSTKNSTVYVQLLVNTESDNVQLFGGEKISSLQSVMAVRIPIDNVKEFIEQNSVKFVEISQKYKITLDESRKEIGADRVQNGSGLPRKLTGKGVIVGVFDTGIDFKHPDFSTEAGTRIQYLWDMSDETGTPPSNFDWGSEYKKSDIDNTPQNVAEKDLNGHGTHVAGTAVGNGRGNASMMGIATEADLIVVKGSRKVEGDGFEDVDILAGCQYIFEKAKELGKPAVINLSLGTILGSHDGGSVLEMALTQMSVPGNIIVVAAGNDGLLPIHAGTEYGAGENIECLINAIDLCTFFEDLCPDIPGIALTAADVWYQGNTMDSIFVGIYLPGGGSGLQFAKEIGVKVGEAIENSPIDINGTIIAYISIDAVTVNNPNNGDGNAFITISNNGNGTQQFLGYPWSLRFKTKEAGKLDLWAGIPNSENSPLKGRYTTFGGNNSMTIGKPASAKKVISVGSYVTKNEWTSKTGQQSGSNLTLGVISTFSSLGPTRDGRVAPMVTAPGEIIFAAASSDMNQDDKQNIITPDGKYYGISGTSMATPHVTGVIAMLLQAKPNLSFEDVETLIKEWSRKDERTGDDLPNNTWGYGKIDAYFFALNTLISSIEENFGNDMYSIHPNPAHDNITIASDDNEMILSVSIADITGNVVYTISDAKTSKLTIPVNGFTSGIYSTTVKTAKGIRNGSFTVFK